MLVCLLLCFCLVVMDRRSKIVLVNRRVLLLMPPGSRQLQGRSWIILTFLTMTCASRHSRTLVSIKSIQSTCNDSYQQFFNIYWWDSCWRVLFVWYHILLPPTEWHVMTHDTFFTWHNRRVLLLRVWLLLMLGKKMMCMPFGAVTHARVLLCFGVNEMYHIYL